MKNGAIEINVVGVPMNDGRILWLEDVAGGKAGTIATAEFGNIILARMAHAYEMQKAQEEMAQEALRLRKALGIQGC